MFRCDHPSGVSLAEREPPRPIRLTPYGGYFVRGDSRLGTQGTIIDAEWLNMLQEELCNVVLLNRDAPDNVLDKSSRTQLLDTILAISGGGGTDPGDGGAGITEPPNNDKLHSRYTLDPTPGPPETGDWEPVMPEAPPSPNGEAYSRQWPATATEAQWVISSGKRRVTGGAGGDEPETFYVERGTPAAGDDGTLDKPFRSIQIAVDYVIQNIDAANIGVDILVGPHVAAGFTTFWDGFTVTRRVLNCPPGKFRVLRRSRLDDDCTLGPAVYGNDDMKRCCIYINGGSVAVGGFRFEQKPGTIGLAWELKGVAIKCEGTGSVCTIETQVYFTDRRNTLDHLWANAGGVIKVNADNYTLESSGTNPPLQERQNHHMHCSNAGIIIFKEAFELIMSHASNQMNCLILIMIETGGIALLRYSWTYARRGGVVNGPCVQWYISGNGVLDMSPMWTTYNDIPIPTNAVNLVPGVSLAGPDNNRSGGRYVPPTLQEG
jgi:hypothetical protein